MSRKRAADTALTKPEHEDEDVLAKLLSVLSESQAQRAALMEQSPRLSHILHVAEVLHEMLLVVRAEEDQQLTQTQLELSWLRHLNRARIAFGGPNGSGYVVA